MMQSPSTEPHGFQPRLRCTKDALPFLLDKHVGVIRSIEWYQPRSTDPQFVHCHAQLADVSRITGRPCESISGGTALGADEAITKAIGEAVERYCSALYYPAEIATSSYDELPGQSVDPRRFSLFHPEQYQTPHFPFSPVKAKSRLSWVEGFSLTRREAVWIPLTMAHDFHHPQNPDEMFDVTPVSGYACGLTLEEAVLRGIYEVIERDSFMIHWYNRLPAPAIDLHNHRSARLQQTLDRFHNSPARVYCFDLTTDTNIHTVLALMKGQDASWPAIVSATAADINPTEALLKALLELSSNHLFVRSLWESTPQQMPQSAEDVLTLEDHALFYSDHRRTRHLNHLLRADLEPRPFVSALATVKEAVDSIELAVQRLARLDLEVTYVELTTPDVEALGLKVVKVIIPGTQPIDFGVRYPHLGGMRIYQSPARMGYNIARNHPSQLNLLPHPFP